MRSVYLAHVSAVCWLSHAGLHGAAVFSSLRPSWDAPGVSGWVGCVPLPAMAGVQEGNQKQSKRLRTQPGNQHTSLPPHPTELSKPQDRALHQRVGSCTPSLSRRNCKVTWEEWESREGKELEPVLSIIVSSLMKTMSAHSLIVL